MREKSTLQKTKQHDSVCLVYVILHVYTFSAAGNGERRRKKARKKPRKKPKKKERKKEKKKEKKKERKTEEEVGRQHH